MQLYLLMRVNVDVALNTFLSHVGPGVPAHPLPLAFRAFVFTEAPLLSLIRGQAFAFGSSLNTKYIDNKSFIRDLMCNPLGAYDIRKLDVSQPVDLDSFAKHLGFCLSPPKL